MGDECEVRVGGIEQDVVLMALRHERWNQQDGGAGFSKPTVAESPAGRLIRCIPAWQGRGRETFNRETIWNFDGKNGVSMGQAVEVGVDQDFKDRAGVGFSGVDHAAAGRVPAAAAETSARSVKERKTSVANAEAAHERRFQAGMP